MSTIFTEALLLRSLALFLLLGSVAGLLAGAMMMWRPEWLTRLSKHANSWVSTRQFARPLERSVNLENWFYRNSYWSGGALLAGAIYIIYMFTAQVGRADLLPGLARMQLVPHVLLEPVLDTLVLFFLAGALLALIVSLFLIFRPSMLRDLELGANQRISLRKTLKPMEMQHANLDQLVFRNIQLAGVLLLCGSLYTLVALAFWLGR
jgi:hypothetical protein